VDVRLSAAFPNIFFVYSAKAAGNVERKIVEPGLPPGGVIIVAGEDICDWVLLKGEFFHLYAPQAKAPACVPDLGKVQLASATPSSRPEVYYVEPDYTVRDISNQAYLKLAALTQFDAGHINDDRPVATPNGKGALIFGLDTGGGETKTLTVISGFSYRYDKLTVKPGDTLKFSATMVYPTKEPARAVVKITGGDGVAKTAYSVVLPVRPAHGPIPNVSAAIPLDAYTGPISVAFSVETPGTDSSAQWVAFDQPRISNAGSRQ